MGALVHYDELTYPVAGESRAHLRMGLTVLGPARHGRTHPGYTDWTLAWSHGYVWRTVGWQAADVRVTAHVTVTVPRWHPVGAPDPGTALAWERYLQEIRHHEEGHVALVPRNVRAVIEAIHAVAPTPDRKTLDALVQAAVDARVALHHEADRDHDRHAPPIGILGGVTEAPWNHPAMDKARR